jgi:hypothetical protein
LPDLALVADTLAINRICYLKDEPRYTIVVQQLRRWKADLSHLIPMKRVRFAGPGSRLE